MFIEVRPEPAGGGENSSAVGENAAMENFHFFVVNFVLWKVDFVDNLRKVSYLFLWVGRVNFEVLVDCAEFGLVGVVGNWGEICIEHSWRCMLILYLFYLGFYYVRRRIFSFLIN